MGDVYSKGKVKKKKRKEAAVHHVFAVLTLPSPTSCLHPSGGCERNE